jgi:hypothetical protein
MSTVGDMTEVPRDAIDILRGPFFARLPGTLLFGLGMFSMLWSDQMTSTRVLKNDN